MKESVPRFTHAADVVGPPAAFRRETREHAERKLCLSDLATAYILNRLRF